METTTSFTWQRSNINPKPDGLLLDLKLGANLLVVGGNTYTVGVAVGHASQLRWCVLLPGSTDWRLLKSSTTVGVDRWILTNFLYKDHLYVVTQDGISQFDLVINETTMIKAFSRPFATGTFLPSTSDIVLITAAVDVYCFNLESMHWKSYKVTGSLPRNLDRGVSSCSSEDAIYYCGDELSRSDIYTLKAKGKALVFTRLWDSRDTNVVPELWQYLTLTLVGSKLFVFGGSFLDTVTDMFGGDMNQILPLVSGNKCV